MSERRLSYREAVAKWQREARGEPEPDLADLPPPGTSTCLYCRTVSDGGHAKCPHCGAPTSS